MNNKNCDINYIDLKSTIVVHQKCKEEISMEISNGLKVFRKKEIIANVVGNNLVILSRDGKRIYRLNQTARYIFENCEGKTLETLASAIIDSCNNKEDLSIDKIIEDCKAVLNDFYKYDLVFFK